MYANPFPSLSLSTNSGSRDRRRQSPFPSTKSLRREIPKGPKFLVHPLHSPPKTELSKTAMSGDFGGGEGDGGVMEAGNKYISGSEA